VDRFSRRSAAIALFVVSSSVITGNDRSLEIFADWTDRVAKGEVPPAPERPKGIERNLVVALGDFGDSFIHDEVATDKNHPTVNANGPVYAVSAATDS
jgi:hypothetical protein